MSRIDADQRLHLVGDDADATIDLYEAKYNHAAFKGAVSLLRACKFTFYMHPTNPFADPLGQFQKIPLRVFHGIALSTFSPAEFVKFDALSKSTVTNVHSATPPADLTNLFCTDFVVLVVNMFVRKNFYSDRTVGRDLFLRMCDWMDSFNLSYFTRKGLKLRAMERLDVFMTAEETANTFAEFIRKHKLFTKFEDRFVVI